jgi:hypothetical protein
MPSPCEPPLKDTIVNQSVVALPRRTHQEEYFHPEPVTLFEDPLETRILAEPGRTMLAEGPNPLENPIFVFAGMGMGTIPASAVPAATPSAPAPRAESDANRFTFARLIRMRMSSPPISDKKIPHYPNHTLG